MLWMDSRQGHIEQDRSAREHSGYTSVSARFAQVYYRSPVAALENSCQGGRSAEKFRGGVKLIVLFQSVGGDLWLLWKTGEDWFEQVGSGH